MAFPFGPFWSAVAWLEEGVWANPVLQDNSTQTKRTLPKKLVNFIIFCFMSINNYNSHYLTSFVYYFFYNGFRLLAILHVNALKILPDGHIKNGQFIKIGVPAKILQDAQGLVVLVIVLQCHRIIYLGKWVRVDFQKHLIIFAD